MSDRIDDLIKEPVPKRDRRIDEAWEAVLLTKNGRRVVYDLLQVCHFGKSAFTGQNDLTNFMAGKQMVAEHIVDMINSLTPEIYHLIMKEAKEDQDHDRRDSGGVTPSGSKDRGNG